MLIHRTLRLERFFNRSFIIDAPGQRSQRQPDGRVQVRMTLRRRKQIVQSFSGLFAAIFNYDKIVRFSLDEPGGTFFADVVSPIGVGASGTTLVVTQSTSGDLLSIDSLGNVTVIATLPSFTGDERYLAVAPNAGGFISGNIFVTQGTSIYKVVGGTVTLFATLPSAGPDHTSICFDMIGTFGHKMIVTTSDPSGFTNGGKVFTIDSLGTVTLLADISSFTPSSQVLEGPAVVPSGFGPHGGEVWIADEINSWVWSVSPSGVITPELVDWPGAEGVLVDPSNGDVWVSSESGSGTVRILWDGSAYGYDFTVYYNVPDGQFEGAAFA